MFFATIDGNILGNVLGSFIAVIGAVGVLFLSEWWRSYRQTQETKENFLKELEYNKAMIADCRSSVKMMIEKLGVGSSDLYFSYNSGNILTISVQKAYQEGLLYQHIKPEKIAKLNSDVLVFFGNAQSPIENFVGEKINAWKAGTLSQEELYQVLVWMRDKSTTALKLIGEVEREFKKSNSNA